MNIHGFSLGRIINPDGQSHEGQNILRNAQHRAFVLMKHSVGPGDNVIISHSGSAEFFTDLLATWIVGACGVCLTKDISDFELDNVVDLISPKLILVGVEKKLVNTNLKSICISDWSADNLACSVNEFGYGALDDNALILFTSGTTSSPKGVMHTYRNILTRITRNRQQLGDSVLQKTLCSLPTHFGHGLIGNCLTPWFAGGDVYLYPLDNLTRVSVLGKFIDEREISFMSSVPAAWKMIAKLSPPPEGETLKKITVGSAPLAADLWKKIVVWSGTRDVINMYGITEAANWIGGASALDFEPEDGLVGRPWEGNVAVLQESGKICRYGVGELLIQTPSLMKGYYNRSDLTAAAMLGGFFRTGDIAKVGHDGVIRMIGRKKLEINRSGLKVSPEDIELLLESNPLVLEACVFAIPHDVAGELVGVALVFEKSSEGQAIKDSELQMLNTIKGWVKNRLDKNKVPDSWYVLPNLKKTDRGKLDRSFVASYCLSMNPNEE